MVKAIKVVAGLIWVYSYATLGAMMAVAAVPAYLLSQWGWDLDLAVGGPSWWPPLVDAFLGMYFSILGFFVFGIALMIVLPTLRIIFRTLTLFRMKPHIGDVPTHSFRIFPWYNENGMMFMFNTIYGRFARLTTLYPWYLRAMGARIGADTVVNTHHIYDLDIIEIGDKTVIGANASILGHVGEKGRLLRAPVKIGNHCTVGQYSNIFPGVVMGDNCHVGAMSLVPKGMKLDANAVYGGVPVRKIRDLSPGKAPTSDETSATTGVPADGES